MSSYRERLERSGRVTEFEAARSANDANAMKRILASAKFAPLEIEYILWSKGDIGYAPADDDSRKLLWNAIVGRIAIALVSGAVLGCSFVYGSSGLAKRNRAGRSGTDVLMTDYRTPQEAYYQPFAWGFVIGAVGGLVSGGLVYDPTAKKGLTRR